MIIETLKQFETYINNIYLVCKNKDKTLMESYFTDDFIHPYNDFSSIDVKDIYFVLFKKNIQDNVQPKFLFSIYGSSYPIGVQVSFMDVRKSIDYISSNLKDEIVNKYFKNLIQSSNYNVVEIDLEEFVNKMNEFNYI